MSRDSFASGDFQPSRRACLKLLAGAPLLAAGCGAERYDDRLRETKAFYEYLERVNSALVPKPLAIEGVEIRVPLQFDYLAPPPPPKDEQQEPPPLDAAVDPIRLGYHPNVFLDGVLGTWKANVRIDSQGNDSPANAPAFLHLLSNHNRWAARQSDTEVEPMKYLESLANQLADAFQVVQDTAEEPWKWDPIKGFAPYVSRKKVESINIPINGNDRHPPLEAVFYRFENKDIQIGLVLVIPAAIDPREKLEERLKHTLETMKVPGQAPQKKSNRPSTGF